MTGAEIRRALWERTGPMFTGLAWSVPAAMWIGLAVGGLPAATDGIEFSLLIPALLTVAVMLLLEKRLTWTGRAIAAVLGVVPTVFLVFGQLPGGLLVISALEVITALAWGVVIVSLGIGHIAPTRALAGRSMGLRLAPLSAWLVITSLWVVIQASPTSPLALEGGVLEIQMVTVAGITGLAVLLVSAVIDRIPALRLPTTGAGRLR